MNLKTTTCIALLAAAPSVCGAMPFTVQAVEIDATATISDGNTIVVTDHFAGGGNPLPEPIVGDIAVESNFGSLATAFAVGESGFVSVVTEAAGAGESALADAAVTFTGQFTSSGSPLQLVLDFENLAETFGAASVMTELGYSVVSGTDTLLNEVLQIVGNDDSLQTLTHTLAIAAGLDATFSVTLHAVSSADSLAFAAQLSSVGFAITAVPLPTALVGFSATLAAMGLFTRRRRYTSRSQGAGVGE